MVLPEIAADLFQPDRGMNLHGMFCDSEFRGSFSLRQAVDLPQSEYPATTRRQ